MSFDLLARHYRWMERLSAGQELQNCRTAFLDRTLHSRSALFLGEGNGRFLIPFLQFNSTARVTIVEQSPRMIDCARQAIRRAGLDEKRIEFIQANILQSHLPTGQFDLIASHFFLDCFPREILESLIPRLAQSGRPDCLWLFADFQVPAKAHPLLRLRAQVLLKIMYTFFRAVTGIPARQLIEPAPFLEKSSFRLADRITAQHGFVRSECWVRTAPQLPVAP